MHIVSSATTVDAGDSVNLTASIAGGVTWKIASGGGALSNVTTSSVTYTAPDPVAVVTAVVTATSITNPNTSSNITLTVPANPTVTTSSLASGTVGTPYKATLAGSGGITPYTWSVSSGTLPPGLNLVPSTGVISGTPTAPAGTATLTFKLTDSGKATPLTAISQSLNLTINAAPAISFTNASLPGGTYKVSYTASAAATGGAGTLTYSLTSGPLPTGLSLNASTGAITGTPTAVGTFSITVTAADAYGDSLTEAYSITIVYPALSVNPVTFPAGYAGLSYSSPALTATGGNGGPYTWTTDGPGTASLTAVGLSLNSSTGVISGATPIQGTASFTVTAEDSASNTGSAALSITVKPGVSITTSSLPTAYTGSNYSQTLVATGGNNGPYTWAIAGGSLPPTFGLSAAGVITGAPTATGGPFGFTVKATDSLGNTNTAALSITVAAGVSITTAPALAAGYQGEAYPTTTLAATGGTGAPYTWTVTGTNTLTAAGLSLSSAGVISGTPTTSGTISFTAQATDSSGNNMGSQTFSLPVEATVAITTAATLPGGSPSAAYFQQLAATGGTGTYPTWTITAGVSSLSAVGLGLNTSTGVISGPTPVVGTATFTVTVTDSASHTSQPVAFTVTISNALTITTTTLPAANTGSAYSQTLTAAGGSGGYTSWAVAGGSLPTGLSLNASSGVISGTPTTTTGSPFNFTVTVKDSNGTTSPAAALSITVYSSVTLAPPAGALPAATVGAPYNATNNPTITASGGSGTYSNWTVTDLTDNLTYGPSGGTLTIGGTPTLATTVSFNVSVTDTTTGVVFGPFAYTIVVNPYTAVALSSTQSGLPLTATVNQSYAGTITATGGVPPYTYTVNTTAVGGSSAPLTSGGGLYGASNGNSLTLSNQPTAPGPITLNVSVKDGENNTASQTYIITVGSGASFGSNINQNTCGNSVPLPPTTVNLSDTNGTVQTVDGGSGNFNFSGVPDGTYTVTPTVTSLTAPDSAVFYPATQSVTVTGGVASTLTSFTVALGYTVSGTVSYTEGHTGQIYLSLNNNNCGSGNSQPGTSIPSTSLVSGQASYTIQGVPPGNYTLQANMDILGYGAPNANDPSSGSSSPSVSVSNFDQTGVSVSLANAGTVDLSAGTQISVSPADKTAVIAYQAIATQDSNGNKVEEATSYTVHWSTSSSSCTTSSNTKTFPATGAGGANIWIVSGLADGTAYYFCAKGSAPGTADSPWFTTSSAVTIDPPTGANTVSGTVTFPGTAHGPLYVGFFDQNTHRVYAAVLGSATTPPVSGATYSVKAPSTPAGDSYYFFGILDNNNDGLIDAGDITNTNSGQDSAYSVNLTGSLTGKILDLTPFGANSNVALTTQHSKGTSPGGSYENYSLNFDVRSGVKLPVAVQLTAGPNVLLPQDIGLCTQCGNTQYNWSINVNGNRPVVTPTPDSYTLHVIYSGTPETSEDVTVSVNAVLDAFATNLAPTGSQPGDTTPTFTWTDPANASSYTYQFYISGNNVNWQIPGNNSNSNGFSSSVTSITWPDDPTDSTNDCVGCTLTSGQQYNWQIQVQDSNGNSTQQQVSLTP